MTEISKTADKALAILAELARSGPSSPQQLSQSLGINRTVAQRLLMTLLSRDFVARTGGEYSLSPHVRRLADSVLPELRATIRRIDEGLAATTGETVLTASTSTCTSCRVSSSGAACLMTSDRCVTTTEARSMTVAPSAASTSASSCGTHVAGRPKTGSVVGLPGRPRDSSPRTMAWPRGALPRAASMPCRRTTYSDGPRPASSRPTRRVTATSRWPTM